MMKVKQLEETKGAKAIAMMTAMMGVTMMMKMGVTMTMKMGVTTMTKMVETMGSHPQYLLMST